MAKRKKNTKEQPRKLKNQPNAVLPPAYIKRENDESLEAHCESDMNELLDTVHANEETVSNLENPTSMIENQITLKPITHACIKQEPSELPVMDIQEGTANTIVEPCDSTSQILNFKVKEESVEKNSHDSQIFSTPSTDNTITPTDSINLKRKNEMIQKGETIRKRIKMEPEEEPNNLFNRIDSTAMSSTVNNTCENICASDGEILENGVNEVSSSNISENRNTDNDVLGLSAEKSKKVIEVICLSDSDDENVISKNAPISSSEVNVIPPQNSENTPVFSTEINKQIIPPKDSDLTYVKENDEHKTISTDTLRYINIKSKLNRLDCHKALNFLGKYKTNTPIEKFFPKNKKKDKTMHEIREDFLFEKVAPTPKKSIPVLNNDNCNTPHFVNTSASNSQEQLADVSVEQLKNILQNCLNNPSIVSLMSNLENNNVAVTHHEIIPSLPITSQPLHTSQKSPIPSKKAIHNFELSSHSSVNRDRTTPPYVEEILSPHDLRHKLNLKRSGNIQGNNATTVLSQSTASQSLSAFQKPSISSNQPTVDVALPSCSSVNRERRLANKNTFPSRKENERDLLNKNRKSSLKTRSLKSFDNRIKDVVLKPTKNTASIAIIQLKKNRKPKEYRNEIIKTVSMPHTLVCLIQIFRKLDRVLLITQLASVIAYGRKNQSDVAAVAKTYRFKLLICVKNEELLYQLFERLIAYEPVLVVCAERVKLRQGLVKHTLADRLERKGNLSDILNDSHIFITTLSAFGTAERKQMSKINKLACLVDEAHLCSEFETALLLPLKLKKLLLIGDKNRLPCFKHNPKSRKLNLSVFVRLFKAKSLSC